MSVLGRIFGKQADSKRKEAPMRDVPALADSLAGKLKSWGSAGNGQHPNLSRARVVDTLLQAWLGGGLRHLFSVRWSRCVDIDVAPRDFTMGVA